MKITDLRAYVVRAQESRPWMFVEIDTDEGITGYGESTNVGGGGAIVIAQTYALLKHDLVGRIFRMGWWVKTRTISIGFGIRSIAALALSVREDLQPR